MKEASSLSRIEFPRVFCFISLRISFLILSPRRHHFLSNLRTLLGPPAFLYRLRAFHRINTYTLPLFSHLYTRLSLRFSLSPSFPFIFLFSWLLVLFFLLCSSNTPHHRRLHSSPCPNLQPVAYRLIDKCFRTTQFQRETNVWKAPTSARKRRTAAPRRRRSARTGSWVWW